jgi:hypothetical protein
MYRSLIEVHERHILLPSSRLKTFFFLQNDGKIYQSLQCHKGNHKKMTYGTWTGLIWLMIEISDDLL